MNSDVIKRSTIKLSKVEEKLSHLLVKNGDAVNKSIAYRKYGKWFLKESNLKNGNFSRKLHIPGINTKLYPTTNIKRLANLLLKKEKISDVLGIIWGWSHADRCFFQCSADLVRVFWYIRACYLYNNIPFTVKLDVKSKEGKLQKEVERIEWLKSTEAYKSNDHIFVPNIIHSCFEEDLSFYCDEMIFGRTMHINDKNYDNVKYVFDFLWTLYGEYGIEFKDIKDINPSNHFIKNVNEAADYIEWKDDLMAKSYFKERVEKFVNSKCVYPCSFTHGDLFGDIIISGKKIYIVDWANSAVQPIIFDMLPFINGLSNGKKLVNQKINKMSKLNNTATVDDQLLLRHLYKIDNLVNRIKNYSPAEPYSIDTLKQQLLNRMFLVNKFLINK